MSVHRYLVWKPKQTRYTGVDCPNLPNEIGPPDTLFSSYNQDSSSEAPNYGGIPAESYRSPDPAIRIS